LSGHHDPGSSAVDTRLPCALGGDLIALGVELLDGLPEVPDVALKILGVPVVRDLLEATVDVQLVNDHGVRDAEDHLRFLGHREHVDRLCPSLTPSCRYVVPGSRGK
jgi:hypothetical protein